MKVNLPNADPSNLVLQKKRWTSIRLHGNKLVFLLMSSGHKARLGSVTKSLKVGRGKSCCFLHQCCGVATLPFSLPTNDAAAAMANRTSHLFMTEKRLVLSGRGWNIKICHTILLCALVSVHPQGGDGTSLWSPVLLGLTGGSSSPPRTAPELMSTSPIAPGSGYSLQCPLDRA